MGKYTYIYIYRYGEGKEAYLAHEAKPENRNVETNRDSMIQLITEKEIRIVNTIFDKAPEKLITYKRPEKKHFEEPWTHKDCAQID